MRFLCVLVLSGSCVWAFDSTVKVDNDVVRILKAVDLPHQKSALHRHEWNRVMIYLDSGDLEVTTQDGHKEQQHWKAGQVAWSPAGPLHTSENVGSAPLRIVEVEVKKPAPTIPVMRKPNLDLLVIDSKHTMLVFENDQVRVFRAWREPGATEPMHEHGGAGRAVVTLTDLDASSQSVDGASTRQRLPAGEVIWTGPVIHAATNLGSKKFEMVLVEVK